MGSTGTGGRQTTHSCNQKIRLVPDFLIASIKLICKTIYKANLKNQIYQGCWPGKSAGKSTKEIYKTAAK